MLLAANGSMHDCNIKFTDLTIHVDLTLVSDEKNDLNAFKNNLNDLINPFFINGFLLKITQMILSRWP